MRTSAFACLIVFAFLRAASAAPAPSEPQVRGWLSLAWDAHDSGLFEEALGYLREVPPGSSLEAEGAWLRAECLYDLGRYREAAEVLTSEAARALEDRDAFLLDVYWDWAWEATGREAWGEVAEVLARARKALPADPSLRELALASRFRAAVAARVDGERRRLPSGEEVAVRKLGAPPVGSGWRRAWPWRTDLRWVPQVTMEQWMPRTAARLRREGRALWVKVPTEALLGRLAQEARRAGLGVAREPSGLWVTLGEEEEFVDAREWAARAAAEGLGAAGAAASAVGRTRDRLEARAALVAWVGEHAEGLRVERHGAELGLTHPRTGRRFWLDPDAWAETLASEPEQWEGFWRELTAELARPARPFRCFCGRPAVLRETLVAEPGPALVFDRGPGFSVAVLALCPFHQQVVTDELLAQWGVSPEQAWERARQDAVGEAWEVTFAREQAEGGEYLTLRGEGVASLARSPELLLGALERVEGATVRGRSVRVLAPGPSSLVVLPEAAPEPVARAAVERVLLEAARQGGAVERLDFAATLRLPRRGKGTFRVSLAE
ncbi:MAG: hypothetical protein Kow0092_35460 [Deferrisomatales bacterium]